MVQEGRCLEERLYVEDSVLKKFNFNPYYLSICSEQADPLIVNGREMINLATNNYLGFSNDKRIKAAYIDAINKYGVSMCATPIAGGYTELFNELFQHEASGTCLCLTPIGFCAESSAS